MKSKVRIRVRIPRPRDDADELEQLVPTIRPAMPTVRPGRECDGGKA